MRPSASSMAPVMLPFLLATAVLADELPFQHKVEVYRSEKENVAAFTVRLEQPFLAEEFEKSNYLRLKSPDKRAYLIYPQETRFQQKHAEFYGRLRGEGKVELTLSYEMVSENLDGSRRVEVKQGTIEVIIPPPPAAEETVGARRIYTDWARQQNRHFARLLEYYPDESFFQYCLLQSQARYGVDPPAIPKHMPTSAAVETDLYEVFTGSLAIQESLQRQTLTAESGIGDYDIHVSTLQPPALQSLDYETLLKQKRNEDGVEPQVHEIARLVPADQYLLHFKSMNALGEALDLATQWGDSLLRLYTVQSRDHRLQRKIEQQLCLRRDALNELFAQQVIREVAVTGADPFLLDGTDLTIILHVARPELFQQAAAGWLADTRQDHADLVTRDFNYRGHKVTAHYTNDRTVSSLVTRDGDFWVYSNSHRAIRRVIDAAVDRDASLHSALDYRYVTTILPPSTEDNAGYLFVSQQNIQRLISPAEKISQKRRRQCFNNLVMLNNASLLYRMEYGRSPNSLSQLIDGRFTDVEKIVCPHGGAYAFDAEKDTCTCSLHNRLRYLTPNAELTVLKVSPQESAEYDRYKRRYQEFWQRMFDPIAVRITVAPRMRLEVCVLPLANSSLYTELRSTLGAEARPMDTSRIAPSAVASLLCVPGREHTAVRLRLIPGISDVIQEDLTLTDLSWLGDRISLHLCDGQKVLDIDPARLESLDLPILGRTSTAQQGLFGAFLAAVTLPAYVTLEVEDRDKAERLLDQFSRRIFLKTGKLADTLAVQLDAYRMPDYKQLPIYVLTGQIYAFTMRLHVALVGDQLVLATKPDVLREVIDVSGRNEQPVERLAHLLLRINQRALHRLRDDVQLYWAEKSRVACHRNIISIYNFHELYDVPVDQVSRLSEAKYGVHYYCPDHGDYSFDAERRQVVCSVHGNRERSRQNPRLDQRSSFAQFIESLDEVVAALRFHDDALIATVEIQQRQPTKGTP